ncbi:hypothetical protein [Lacticaseibacillus manihotivorans]|uniref:Uncharacterized protein n=1 Tax=Lacticaseibacillus manihotivorans TaxID=88233 RepID=A0A5P8JSX4_9LACO|nr:hypothetical protein [Lacticaseibacillus manihotivorans]QFQ91799.1 hypothetical protein LM010_10350 [Lacticaseibacillus manihotivorans]
MKKAMAYMSAFVFVLSVLELILFTISAIALIRWVSVEVILIVTTIVSAIVTFKSFRIEFD